MSKESSDNRLVDWEQVGEWARQYEANRGSPYVGVWLRGLEVDSARRSVGPQLNVLGLVPEGPYEDCF